MNESVRVDFSVGGGGEQALQAITSAAQDAISPLEELREIGGSIGLSDLVESLQKVSAPGIELQTVMADLSAATGITGDRLGEVSSLARETAKAFGMNAAESAEAYKSVLSKLSPELSKFPDQLGEMGRAVATLSKSMGGDAEDAADALATAMTQFGVSLKDPAAAAQKMKEMMNVMAAAGRAGTSDISETAAAIEKCGGAAKDAGVSFEDANAAIQVLNATGEKAAEGGRRLGAVFSAIGSSQAIPPELSEKLRAAGVNVSALTDQSRSLSERMQELKPVIADTALLSSLFGRSNTEAAQHLIQNTSALSEFAEAVTGTNAAEEAANAVMDTFAERQARIRAHIEDLKISFFEATGGLTEYASAAMEAINSVADFGPMFIAAKDGLFQLSDAWKEHGMTEKIKAFGAKAKASLAKVAASLNITSLSSMGVGGAFKAMSAMAQSACRAVSTAIVSIPIVGWIAGAVAAIMVLFEKCETFRAVVYLYFGFVKDYIMLYVNFFKTIFTTVWSAVQSCWEWLADTGGGIMEWLCNMCEPVARVAAAIKEKIGAAVKYVYDKFMVFFSAVKDLFVKIFGKRWEESKKQARRGDEAEAKASEGKDGAKRPEVQTGTPEASPSSMAVEKASKAAVTGGSRPVSITITMDKVIENIVFNGSLDDNRGSMERKIEESLYKVLLSAAAAAR